MHPIAESIAARLMFKGAIAGWGKLAEQDWLSTRGAHRRALQRALRRMPFIYNELELEVAADFVGVEISSLERASLGDPAFVMRDGQDTFVRLRDMRRLVLVGGAGIGKTTLFRYCIHSLLNPAVKGLRLHPKERVLPFYVQLKALDNSSPSPILRYLLANNRYLTGKRGIRRLTRLAERHRLMLFLDGYDEIPHAGGTRFITDELTTLFGTVGGDKLSGFVDATYRDLYRTMRHCRIWVSTRREFFVTYPFDFARDVALFRVNAMNDQRIHLVEKIFNRYRAGGSEYFADRLNAEFFMQQLARAPDEGLRNLSYTPLYLTVMCYVYVGRLREGEDPEDVWKRGTAEITNMCLRLLITDLDEYKARDFTALERAAFSRRRAEYPAEKLDFLKYLATQSYVESIPVFQRIYLLNEARDFFAARPNTPTTREILRGLSDDDSERNLVSQLISSGVFVLVEKSTTTEVFDFPHRRFREILATQFLDNADGCELVIGRATEAQFMELILVYVEQTQYGPQVVRALLKELYDTSMSFRIGTLINDCLERIPPSAMNASDVVRGIVMTLVSQRLTLELPRAMLRHLTNDLSFQESLSELGVRSIGSKDRLLFSIVWPVLHAVNRAALRDLLRKNFELARAKDSFGVDIVLAVLDTSPGMIAPPLVRNEREAESLTKEARELRHDSLQTWVVATSASPKGVQQAEGSKQPDDEQQSAFSAACEVRNMQLEVVFEIRDNLGLLQPGFDQMAAEYFRDFSPREWANLRELRWSRLARNSHANLISTFEVTAQFAVLGAAAADLDWLQTFDINKPLLRLEFNSRNDCDVFVEPSRKRVRVIQRNMHVRAKTADLCPVKQLAMEQLVGMVCALRFIPRRRSYVRWDQPSQLDWSTDDNAWDALSAKPEEAWLSLDRSIRPLKLSPRQGLASTGLLQDVFFVEFPADRSGMLDLMRPA